MDEKINILAVDDVPQNIAAIAALFAQGNLRVLSAGSGTEALELLLVNDVALALVDVQMPGMDGLELAELMRGAERTRDIPIIFMTAALHDEARIFQGYEVGAIDFLYKPLDPQILKSKVAAFVELYSQRRKLSTQLDALRASLRLNEMFLAALGHDLRNPLNAIAVSAEVLLRGSTEPLVTSTARRIRSSSARMATMIEQLLDVARLRAGGVRLTMQLGDVSEVCRTIRDELDSANAPGRIAVTVSGDAQATFDADRLSQVLSNLVGNALQHSEPGTPVGISVDGADPKLVMVQVRNEGFITEEHMKTLFEPFQSGKSSRKGLGLGLYITKQVVEAHGGRVAAHSNGGHHTVFEFSIPRRPPVGTDSERRLTL